MFKAGTAIADISPKKGVQLFGYPHCPRPNTGVHDPIYAACLFLKGNIEKVFVTLDILLINKSSVNNIRSVFPKIDITICVSHTHSAPRTRKPMASEIIEGMKLDESYVEFLENQIISIIKKAKENTFTATIGSHKSVCGGERGIGGNRRHKGGVSDPSVNVIAVKDEKNVVRTIFFNYSLHPTYLHAENTLVTADYPAYTREFIKYCYPEAVFMFAIGTAGDQSSRYFRTAQNFEEAARAGTTLGCAVFDCIKKTKFENELKINVKNFDLKDLPLKKYPSQEETLKEIKKKEKAFIEAKNSGDYIKMRNAELDLFGAQNVHEFSVMAKDFDSNPEFPGEVQLIKLNDTLIATIPAEIFVEYGLAIKKISNTKKTFVCGLTNGYMPGYIYTPQAGKEGGYEIGTSCFADKAGEELLKQVKENIKNV